MANALYWYSDGTFGDLPVYVDQLYTIFASLNDSIEPLVYCLLPNREQKIYEKVFQKLNELEVGIEYGTYALALNLNSFQNWHRQNLLAYFFLLIDI